MIYRLLALNIDGTLLQPNGRLHKITKEAVEYVQEKGVYVTLITSRHFLSAKKVAKALNLKSMLITHRGGYIASTLDKPILEKRIPEDITFEIVKLLEEFQCRIRIVHERYSLTNKSGLIDNLLAKAVFNTGDPLFYPQQYVDSISNTIMDEPTSPPNIEVIFKNKEDMEDSQKAIMSMYSEVNVVKLNENRLEIVPWGSSQLNGLYFLGNHLGIDRKEMVAIGDSIDDMDMIEGVGLGVAMGNAPVELKKAADWVTRSNNQHGVAYVVKEHFRKQQPLEFLRKMNIIKS